jgi:hypothetical protein
LFPLLPLVVAREGQLYIGRGTLDEYEQTLSVVAKENPYKDVNVCAGPAPFPPDWHWWEKVRAARLLPNLHGGNAIRQYVAGRRVRLAIALLEAYTPRGLRSPLRVVDKALVRRMVESL